MTKSNPANPSGAKQSKRAARLLPAVGIVLLPLMLAQPARAQTYQVLHSFSGTGGDGSQPIGMLTADSAGNLYGTTSQGGTFDDGTIFEISRPGKVRENVLYSFTGGTSSRYPLAGLTRDAAGNLYGTTYYGGTAPCQCGTVFKLDPAGQFTVLYSFTGNDDAGLPRAPVTLDSQGNLYGTTVSGGGYYGCGAVFEVNATGAETVLYGFTGGAGGVQPEAGLLMGKEGQLVGTTSGGGTYTSGTIFEITAKGAEIVLHSFGGNDGSTPLGGLIRDSAGNLYATAEGGGPNEGAGVVFKFDESGTETVLYTSLENHPSTGYAALGFRVTS